MWWLRRLLRLDKWTNANLLNGYHKETISSRGGKAVKRTREGNAEPGDWKWCILCRFLDIFERDHCVKSIQTEVGRM